MYQQYNANPKARRGDDCTVRAISKVLGLTWEQTYVNLCAYGLKYFDMPTSNFVWGKYLIDRGFTRHIIPVPKQCDQCYTVAMFADDHPQGRYILALHGHVVAVIDGVYYDSWDSGDEVPLYYWMR